MFQRPGRASAAGCQARRHWPSTHSAAGEGDRAQGKVVGSQRGTTEAAAALPGSQAQGVWQGWAGPGRRRHSLALAPNLTVQSPVQKPQLRGSVLVSVHLKSHTSGRDLGQEQPPLKHLVPAGGGGGAGVRRRDDRREGQGKAGVQDGRTGAQARPLAGPTVGTAGLAVAAEHGVDQDVAALRQAGRGGGVRAGVRNVIWHIVMWNVRNVIPMRDVMEGTAHSTAHNLVPCTGQIQTRGRPWAGPAG